MRHPFERIAPERRLVALIAFIVPTLAVMFALQAIDRSLVTDPTPQGIVSFEVCAFDGSCAAAIAAYEDVALEAGMSLGLDYLFMPLYAAAIAATLVFVAARRSERVRSIAAGIAWGSFAAAIFDAAENAALYGMLASGQATPWLAWTAAICASIKFLLVAAGIVACIVVAFLPRVSA
jgi:hypothetical protein